MTHINNEPSCQPLFKAQFSPDFKNPKSNFIYSYMHKQLGWRILEAQRNPHGFTPEEGEKGRAVLKQCGGKRISYTTADNLVINGMHFLGRGCSENSPTLILFNGAGIRYEEYGSQLFNSVRIFTIKHWLKLGLNVLIFNYRGIETSQGSATRNGLILDGDASIQYVRDYLKVPEDKIILHGHSLGAGIAAESAVLHPNVHYCNDRSFSSLSQLVKIMYGGGVFGTQMAKLFQIMDWEFNTIDRWDKIKGHKWLIYHPNDRTILVGGRLLDAIKKVDPQAHIIKMSAQVLQTKRGLQLEDLSQLKNPSNSNLNFARSSTHMRKLYSQEEKSQYEKEVKLALSPERTEGKTLGRGPVTCL